MNVPDFDAMTIETLFRTQKLFNKTFPGSMRFLISFCYLIKFLALLDLKNITLTIVL